MIRASSYFDSRYKITNIKDFSETNVMNNSMRGKY